MDRRNFFKGIIRGGIFSALLGSGAWLMLRNKNDGALCDFDFVCGNCRKNAYCTDMEASKFRLKKRLENGDEKS